MTLEKNNVLVNEIKEAGIAHDNKHYQDKIKFAYFEDGYAIARIEYDTCASEKQLQAIRDSIWKIKHIHANGERVSVKLIEEK